MTNLCRLLVVFMTSMLLTTTTQAQIQEYYTSGKMQIQKNNFDAAIQDFNEAIRLKPDDPEFFYYRAVALKGTRNYPQAIKDLDTAIELLPNESRYHALRGEINLLKKSYDVASKDFDNAIQLDPTIGRYYIDRAKTYQYNKQFAEALNDCQKALKIYPSDHKAYYTKASVLYDLKDLTQATDAIEQAILLSKKNSAYYLLKGKILQQKKDFSNAIDFFNKALVYNPQEAYAHYHTAQIKIQEGALYTALKQVDKAINIDDNISDFYHLKAELYEQINDFKKALSTYDQELSLNPNNVKILTEKAQIHLHLSQYNEAIDFCNQALNTNPYYQEPLVVRGVALFQTNHPQDANEDFYTYLHTATKGRDYYFLSRLIHDHIQDRNLLEKSEQWIFKAIQKDDIYVHNHLYASILHKLGKNINSLEVANKAISLAKKEGKRYDITQKILNAVNQSTVDDIPPVITLASPSVVRGGVVVKSEGKIHIIGKASDESGVKEVLINGNPAKLLSNGDFDGIMLYKSKMKQFEIQATDYKGNLSKTNFPIIKERKMTGPKNKFESLGKCYALIFATDEYDYWNNLVNPINDAKTISKDLSNIYGFEADLVTNPTKQQIVLKLKEYLTKKYNANDQLLIFFAGHGQFDETFKEGYLVTQDSKLDDPTKVSYLPHSVLRTYVNNIQCKHILLMMDVCFGGTFDPLIAIKGVRGNQLSENDNDTEKEEFIRRKLASRTRKYITSGGKEYVPDGRPNNHSPFVRRFLEALRSYGGKDNILTLSEIITHIEMITPEPHAGEFGNNQPGSDFIFVTK